eukprot:jgi/Astpho2/249/fgenesh1_pg.00010_%23_27_t
MAAGAQNGGQARRQMPCHASAAVAERPQQQDNLDVTQMDPLGERLLIKPDEEKQATAGGLLLTGGATKTVHDAVIGEILALGENVDIGVTVGDKVIFSKYSTTDVKVGDGAVHFVDQKSVLAKLS